MTKITWINCADEMPARETYPKIIYILGEQKPLVCDGDSFVSTKAFLDSDYLKKITYWTPYTPEAWKELNKCSQG